MLADVQSSYGLARPFQGAGNFETEHQRVIVREVCAAVQTGRLIVVSGLVGSGKTHLLRRIEDELARAGKVAVAKSLAVDKRRTSLTSLIEALFYDLSSGDRAQVKIPKQAERRERDLRDLMRKGKRPIVLVVDEAHDLHHKTLTGLKRLMEVVADAGVPIVAFNAGQLGYLADVAPERARWALGELAAGRCRTEERMRVQANVGGEVVTGLNEVVVERAFTGHTVRLRVYFDGEFFTSYVSDGMVVATPTGSTAYAFSVRGPIVAPTHRALLMVPVAPHLLFDRALVLEATSTIELEVVGHRPAKVSIDGQGGFDVTPGNRIVCSTASKPARFIRFEELRFHHVLKRKFSLADR